MEIKNDIEIQVKQHILGVKLLLLSIMQSIVTYMHMEMENKTVEQNYTKEYYIHTYYEI